MPIPANVCVALVATPVILSLYVVYVDDGMMIEVDAVVPFFAHFYGDDGAQIEVR